MKTRQKLLWISLVSIAVIALLHILAFRFHWYFAPWWFDVIMHILGGFWVGITTLWICIGFGHICSILHYRTKSFYAVLLSVLIVGVLWEIFEVCTGSASLHAVGYWSDTISDLINNFVGGICAYLYFIQMKNRCSSPVL